jgi:hypothetical protein
MQIKHDDVHGQTGCNNKTFPSPRGNIMQIKHDDVHGQTER